MSENEKPEMIKKINSVITLYNSSYEKPSKWPIEGEYINDINDLKLELQGLLNNNKETLFQSRSNGIAGINWGAMSADDLKKLDDNKINEIAEKLFEVINSLDQKEDDDLKENYKKLLDLFQRSENGFSKTYNVLAARLVATFALGKLFAVPGHTQIFQVAHKLGLVELGEYKTPKDWIVANRRIVNYVRENHSIKIEKLYNENITKDSFAGKQKFSMLGWRLALLCGAGNDKFEEEADFVMKSRNVVYSGAPGTGKSFMANKIARIIIGNEQKENNEATSKGEDGTNWRDNIEIVQFHPSYDYTDFVEGMRPCKDENGNISFKYKEGIFRKFCEKALSNPGQNYVFIIDEINRGDVNKIFGELFFCIDPDKRYDSDNNKEQCAVKTQYANLLTEGNKFDEKLQTKQTKDNYGHFFVPKNVYIIATMNDIDRSVESLDFAFRRRFAWKEVQWEDSVDDIIIGLVNDIPEKIELLKVKEQLKKLNDKISKELGNAYCIGGSFLKKLVGLDSNLKTESALKEIWNTHIENVIREYLRGTDLKLSDFKNAFLSPTQADK